LERSPAADAVGAAQDVQRALMANTHRRQAGARLRMGIHTGEVDAREPRAYGGPALGRGARLRDVAHGGQVLLSSVTASLVADGLPAGAWLVDLGAHRLRDLSRPERIFELCHAELADEFPPPRSLDALANNLPLQVTSFVGRGRELAVVEELIGTRPLVTLTGSGGCGKTRLAVHAAAGLADRWPGGVWCGAVRRQLVLARALPGLAAVHRRLGETDIALEHLDRAVVLCRKLDAPDPLAEALDETAVLAAADDPERAESLHHEALAIRVGQGLRTFYVNSLGVLAQHALRAESFAEAARL
jgi:Tetratricopeptide repeat